MKNLFCNARARFFESTTASEVFSRLCQIEDAAHKHHETTKLHPCHSWPSLKLELSMLRPMAEKYKEFRDFLAEQRKNNDIAERFNVSKDAASLFVYRLANIGVVSKNRKLGSMWISDLVNPALLLNEFRSVMDMPSEEKSIWDIRAEQALTKETDDDPTGEPPRDAKVRLLQTVPENIRERVDFRIWELQVKSMSA